MTTLPRLFATQAARVPHAVAVVGRRHRLTYGELDRHANRLAHRLRRLGIAPETRVAIWLDRTPEMVVAILAAMKAGGAYVPLDPAYPSERTASILTDADPLAVVTRAKLAATLPPTAAAVVAVDRDAAAIAAESEADPRPGPDPRNLAYLIYTSGSTGRPKGVAIEHASAANLVRWAVDAFDAGELAGMLAGTSINFDLSVFELFATLAAGGKVILAETALELPRLAAAAEVTFVNTVPSVAAELVRQAPLPESVRVVGLAGEPLRRELVRRIYAQRGDARVVNLYAPSETTTYSTAVTIPKEADEEPSIGRPIAHTRAHVFGRRAAPAPAGETGELYLGGAGVARGYLHRPGQTAAAFLPDPSPEAAAGGRLYRTGDLARWRADGDLDFLGRADHQVKIRGFRIELGEIEAALDRHPAVRSVAVTAREDEPGDRCLAAYVVSEPGTSPTVAELREFLGPLLPVYMLPRSFDFLEAMPLTPSGKVSRRELPAPKRRGGETAATGRPPEGPIENAVAAVWTEVLGCRSVGADDNFFHLGGHSLAVYRLLSRLRDVLGVELSPSTPFERPTVAGLAAAVEAARGAAAGASPAGVPEVGGERQTWPSLGQEGLWFLEQWLPGTCAYNVPLALRLRGRLEVAALAASLDEIIRRHDVLRARFFAVDGVLHWKAEPPRGLPFTVVDLAALPPGVRRAAGERQLSRESRRRIDLTTGPLIRAHLLLLDERASVLLVAMHHIVTDDWSHQVLVRELAALYQTCRARRGATVTSPLPELGVGYADFARWQRRSLGAERLAHQMAYWRRQLAGAPTVLELPADRPRPARWSARGARWTVPLPQPPVLGQLEGVSTFMVLLAAFVAWLYRYAGQEDMVVGTPIANRVRGEFHGLIGYFLNTLPVRADLARDPSFSQLVGRLRKVCLEAYAHQDVPFHQLVEGVRTPSADAAATETHAPLFQVLLVWQNERPPALAPDVALTVEELDTGTAKFDLTAFVKDQGDGLLAIAEYSTDLYDATTVRRRMEHLRVLAEAIAAGPELRLSELPLLTPAESHQLLAEWNDTGSSYPRDASIPALFDAASAAAPETVALVFGEHQVSYLELGSRAGRLAGVLRGRGVGPEVCVGLGAERSVEMVVAILAVLEAGGAYVPLDPAYPPERQAFMLRAVGAREGAAPLLALQDHLEPPPVSSRLRVVRFGHDAPGPVLSTGPSWTPGADNLAYVMFTSGSTGKPKAVGVTHRNVVRLVRETGYAELGRDQTFLQLAPISFDASTLEMWGPLLNGGRLVVFPGPAPSLEELGDVLVRHGVSTLWLTAGLFHQMVDDHLPGLAPVRQLLAGGDVLSARHVRRVLEELPGCQVTNGYGPTENTTFTCCAALRSPPCGAVAIGRPIANTRVSVLDRHLRPVSAGIPGELYAGGDGVARGYLGRPARTASSFIPSPLGEVAGARLYATGDSVRWHADGRIDFLGRRDDQVKLRGFRIEPGEVETALLRHPAVHQAVVVAPPAEAGSRRLVAYLVAAPGAAKPPVPELRRHLARWLPDYMVPTVWMVLERLPLTPNGKVDRAALPTPEPARPELGRRFVAPRTPIERGLAAIWTKVLGVERVGVEDDFFALGGHSLTALRLISQARVAFQVEVRPQDVFNRPTVAALARHVEALRREEQGLEVPPPEPASRGGDLPLSYAEQRMWLLDQYEGGGTTYNISVALRLGGSLDRAALERSLGEIIRRHESLRTVFPTAAGGPRRRILAPEEWRLPFSDLTWLAAELGDGAARRLLAAELERPFDLAAGPLLRTGLARLDDDDHVLWLAVHHIVADGWSLGILVREMAALYNAFRAGEPSPLAEPALQYADFAHWQRRWLAGEQLAKHLEFWRRSLGENPAPLALPTDRPRPPAPTFAGARIPFELAEDLAAALEDLGRRENTTAFVTLLAAFQVLLSLAARRETFTVGLPVAGRNRAEIEDLIGLFVNTLVLPADLAGDPDFREVLARVRRTTLAAYDHQETPFDKLVEALQKSRDLSRHPLFQVMFDFQHSPLGELRLAGLKVRRVKTASTTAKFDLTLAMAEVDGTLVGEVEYSTDLFAAATVRLLIGYFRDLLTEVAAHPERPLSQLEAGRRMERDPLLAAAHRPLTAAGDGESGRTDELEKRRESLAARRAGLSAAQRALLAKWSRKREEASVHE